MKICPMKADTLHVERQTHMMKPIVGFS